MDLVDFFKSCSLNGCPHLEKLLLLEQQPASADGTWYFLFDPRMTMEEFVEDYLDPDPETIDKLRLQMKEHEVPAPMDVPTNPFRTYTDPAKFREIYLAAADTVRRMPKLLVFASGLNYLDHPHLAKDSTNFDTRSAERGGVAHQPLTSTSAGAYSNGRYQR